MSKNIIFSDETRNKIFRWIETIANTVIITMWPKWRNVIIDKWDWLLQVTNDWVTIAKEVELEDKFENMWASLVKEAAEKTNSIAWDWTTTATLLTYALAKEWQRYIKNWVNAVELKNGMKKATQLISDELYKNSKEITSKEEITQIASISAQDEIVWKIIAEAMDKVWNEWVVSVEEWQTFWLELEITEWMEFENWYLSPYMISDEEKMLAIIKNASILITDKKISSTKELIPFLEKLIQSWKKDLVIIAEDYEWDTLTWLVLNKMKWILNILAIKSPWFWENKKELIKDLSILTWANLITADLWMKIENIELSDLWFASNVVSSKDKTMIIWWGWNNEEIFSRVEDIKNAIEISNDNNIKEKLAERMAKLAWGVAIIKVWAASEVEMKEKKLRIEDWLNATRAAISEWIVAWGWVALLRASKVLNSVDFWNEDQNLWVEIVKKALSYPIKQIVENAWKEWSVIISKIEENLDVNFWYNAATDEYVDMIESWIIDPKKVERVALEEAVSLAGMFLTTEVAITPLTKKEDKIS